MTKCYLDRFKQIMRITRLMAAVCGADILRHDYKMHFLTWFVVAAINIYYACTIYTIYIGIVVNKDWKIILESLCLAGSAIQGYSKLIFAIRGKGILYSMKSKLEAIYEEFQKDDDYSSVLRYRIDFTATILKTILILYITAAICIVFYPIIYGVLNNEKLLIMKFYLPGINPKTEAGYLIHNVVHGILILMGSFGNFAGDMLTFIYITHIPLWKDVLKIKFKKLNSLVGQQETTNAKETMHILREILVWHQNSNMYAQQVEKAYDGVIFVQIFTSVVCISCTLFSIVIRSWPAAFAYLIYSAGLLYAFCGLGHLVEISNDDLVNIIYGECLWYGLTTEEQKIVLLMLRKSQSPVTLTVGQIMPLSMSTALQLTKAIYSYMMMLINFLEGEEI